MTELSVLEGTFLKDFLKESPEKRAELIKSHAYAVEELVYARDLTAEEVEDLKNDYINNNVSLARFEEQLQTIKEDFKNKMNPLKLLGVEYLNELKTKKKQVEGMVYDIDDQEAGLMISLDIEGNVLNVRPLRKGERQLNLNSSNLQKAQ